MLHLTHAQCLYFAGFFSNHSLRASCATRLFNAGVDEQLIARQTGHRSSAIRAYKRPTPHLERTVSSAIQGSKSDNANDDEVSGKRFCADKESGSMNFTINVNFKSGSVSHQVI